ncbi:MAG: YdcF family protein [Cryomorphaceae bacterium]|nr:YdcF family protein [Cryomorphaceae bacterium]
MKLIVLSPSFYLFLTMLLLVWQWKRMSGRRRRIALGTWVLVAYMLTTPFVPLWLISKWENKYPPISALDDTDVYTIVVLGAGHDYDDRLPPTTLLNGASQSRLIEGMRLAYRLPNSRLHTSGWSSSNRIPTGEMKRRAAIALGFPEERLSVQKEPHNTKSEAEIFAKNHHRPADKVILVTSALHIPRAVKHFEGEGVSVIPAPCHYLTFRDNEKSVKALIPQLKYLKTMQGYFKEVLGFYFAL